MTSVARDDPFDSDGRGIEAISTAAVPLRVRPPAAAWVPQALLVVLSLAGLLYVWSLTASGYANEYYSAAAQAAAQDWRALFFGSLDAGSFITIDKPPLSVWAMAVSVRLLGLGPLGILLPQALMGVAAVAVLFAAVRRSFGATAGLVAALVLALTPVAVLIFRYNNPDALLTLLLVLAAWALVRGLEDARLRWLVLSGLFVGLAFNTKFLQAYVVLPAFLVTYLVAASGSLRHRAMGLATAAASVLLASAWWVAIVASLPLGSRPWIGGSADGGVLDVLFGYDGLGRIFGQGGGPGGGPARFAPGAGFGFGGAPGLLRMFNERWGGQIAWLLPLAGVGAAAGLWLRRGAPRVDAARAGYLLWGLWVISHVLVFSLMTGIVHTYYAVAMAPGIAALVGAAVVELWRWRRRSVTGGLVLAAALLTTAGWAAVLLGRTPEFWPALGAAIVALGIAAAIVVGVPARLASDRLARVGLVAGLVATLAAPSAYAIETVGRDYRGGDPSAGPASPADLGGFGLGGFGAGGPGGLLGPGGFGGAGGAGGSRDAVLIAYLTANRDGATWLAAVTGANAAAGLQLASRQPVMAMGGFSGGDPAPTRRQLEAYVRDGRLRFVMVGGDPGGLTGFGGSTVGRDRDAWVRSACHRVAQPGSNADGSPFATTLYDCAGAASAG